MSAPILATKLYIPSLRPEVVLRSRLINRLNEGLHQPDRFGRKVTLISAPAGFGKTTLASAWVTGCGCPVAWLSLERGDDDPVRFLRYLVTALQTIAPEIGTEALSLLQAAPPQPPYDSILATVINDIAAQPECAILVLDDYHVIGTAAADDALTFLIEHLPPALHMVIVTREDPFLPLARLRVRGQLAELRVADLRFTPAEAAEFLNPVMGLNLPRHDIDALEARTEGWIAGLQLAALALQNSLAQHGAHGPQRRQATSDFIQSFTGTHRFVLDYLVEEVLQQQPADVQTFLAYTSVLERICGPLCDTVLEAPTGTGQNTLDYLERVNLLLIPLDDVRQWYRYHHLLADMLHARLLHEHPNLAPTLHRRASMWYEQQGLRIEAIDHALASTDMDWAAHLIELAWPVMDQSFRSTFWIGRAQNLPASAIHARPVLSVGFAWALLDRGELEVAEPYLQAAERWLEPETPAALPVVSDDEQMRLLPATIASARTYLTQARGDVNGTIKYAQRLLDLLPPGDHLQRGQAMTLLGLAHWSNGDLAAAHHLFTEFITAAQNIDDLPGAISAAFVLADIKIALGLMDNAQRLYERVLQIAVREGEPPIPGTQDLYRGLADLYRERNDLTTAAQLLQTADALDTATALPDWPRRRCMTHARLKQAQSDLAGALELLDEAERHAIRTPLPDIYPIPAYRARLWLAQGRLADARAWAEDCGLTVNDDLSYLREYEHLTLARILIAAYQRNHNEDDWHAATTQINRLMGPEKRAKSNILIETWLLMALTLAAHNELSAALKIFELALEQAEQRGYFRLVVDEGQPMAELLSAAAEEGIMPDYVSKLLAAFQTADANQTLLDPLSERELEVLRLVADGLSNQAIADQLFVALNTVKGHNRRIFEKLGVQRRTEAVARAHELGLI